MNRVPQRKSNGLCWSTSRGAELRGICVFQLFPWHQRGEQDHAIVRVQRSAKKQMELLG
jgi:hypothetical protein